MSEHVNVTVRDNPGESRYEALDESGAVAGFAKYHQRDGRVVFTHAEVDDAFEGQGVGSALARGSLDKVRAAGNPVVVECEFIASYIEKHPEYQDLLTR